MYLLATFSLVYVEEILKASGDPNFVSSCSTTTGTTNHPLRSPHESRFDN